MVDVVVAPAPPVVRRRLFHRPYFFETFTLINLAIIHWALSSRHGLNGTLYSLPIMLVPLIGGTALQLALGILMRLGWLAWRNPRRMHGYLHVIRSRQWLVDSVRLLLFVPLTIHVYSWIKLTVPVLHPRLFDQQLWDLDRVIFFGLSPTVFFLSLFSTPPTLRAIDFSYAWFFVAGINFAFLFFLSAPCRRLRVAFNDGNTLLWIAGAWLYLAVPSIGPAFRFPQVWLPYASQLMHTHHLQSLLMHNYQMVLNPRITQDKPINVLLGVAAFPSLHVAFMMFLFLWMRRLNRYGGLLFGLLTVAICIGSVVTGWHYLIDSIAGVVLAWLAFAAATRVHHFFRFRHLREILVR